MTRIYSKLEEIPQAVLQTPTLGRTQIYIFLILGSVTALAAVFFLGNLSSNIATIKNSIFISMDAKIQQQQIQIILLTKKLNALQFSIKNTNNSLEYKFDDLNNSVKSKLDQASINTDHMKTFLQANIDELNTNINKLKE